MAEKIKKTDEGLEAVAAAEAVRPAEVEPQETESTGEASEPTATAKSGKRSTKGLKEAEEKQAKEDRKAHADEGKTESAAEKPKKAVKPARSRLERRGKNFRKAAELIDKTKAYSLKDGLELAIKTNPAKFDASVELHVNLSVDPKHADQNVRDSLVLPAGTGKQVRVAVFDDQPVEGSDVSGVETILKHLEKGELPFDVLIATPAQMPKLGKYARLLGPRGLMPNPKSGTVTTNVAKAVSEAKAGRVEYRVDTTGIVHVAIGKVSFGEQKLEANARAVLESIIKQNKPASIKGAYIKAIHVATTMGPSLKLDPSL